MFELLSAGYKTERGFMKKGEIYEGVIEKVEFPNKGFVWVDDQKVIVKNGIPGQKVRFVNVSLDLAQDLYIRELESIKALDERLNA